jgi:site-specific recombinase XerD
MRFKYVHAFIDRHGHTRYYFRRNGRRIKLPGAFGSHDFLDAYAAALGGQRGQDNQPSRKSAGHGTFAALAARYYASPQFLALSPTSRTGYRRAIERFLGEHGHRRVDQMKREHVDMIIGTFAAKPGAGIIMLKRLRTLLRYAVEIGWRETDPSAGARAYKSHEFHTWTEGEIEQFEQRWPIGTRERLAFDLLLYTGQRGSDVARMARPSLGDKIRVAQQKTGAKLAISVHPNLRRSLDACPSGHVAAIATAYGRAFSVKGFGQFVADTIRKAALPTHCKAHGLRKAAARRLAEAGCSLHEIAAVTGHKTLSEIERYTRAASQEALNASAIEKQAANKQVATLPLRIGNPADKH